MRGVGGREKSEREEGQGKRVGWREGGRVGGEGQEGKIEGVCFPIVFLCGLFFMG